MSENEQPLDVKQSDRAEHERIETALEVERLDVNLFRSKSLWVPNRARGAFGGQVISQAIVSATNCVAPGYSLHVESLVPMLSVAPLIDAIYSHCM
jgi:acyl-CoA thioesterase